MTSSVFESNQHPLKQDNSSGSTENEMTVMRLPVTPTGVILQAGNGDYPDMPVPELSGLCSGES